MATEADGTAVVTVRSLSLRYGKTVALDAINLDFPAGCMVGLIGPDGVGKSSLLALIAGARALQDGTLDVLQGDMGDRQHRNKVCPAIAYMPQGLGKNLYPSLSVEENLQFFARLFGHQKAERRRRIDELTHATGLSAFLDRPVGKLSGGMKQKLGLCCALIHDPELLILDEPTTGVDPLARAQFWALINHIREQRPSMSVIVATAYMEEAENFDWLVAMDAGKVLATGTPQQLHQQTGKQTLEAAFIELLPVEKKRGYKEVIVPPFVEGSDIAIEAKALSMRFGDFTAVDQVDFSIHRGEIFGFLGSNGCGKTTTMKMLTGLLSPSEGEAYLFGKKVNAGDMDTRRRVGYMSQSFSLYSELSVEQNLVLHARLYNVPESQISERVDELLSRFDLEKVRSSLPNPLPLGMRQRLSLAVAMVHSPEILILDEPTSGVDPVARDGFWQLLVELSRNDKVTIFISTHFMNEATRCDRISLMHAGKVLVSDTPDNITRNRGADTLEAAFIAYLEENNLDDKLALPKARSAKVENKSSAATAINLKQKKQPIFSFSRAFSYSQRESLELLRDPVRLTMALVGTVFLMLVMGYGITLDVDDLTYAVLDHDQSQLSQNYALNLSGSRYFIERSPIKDYEDLDRRMRSGELSLAIEIPPNFARNVRRGHPVQIATWFDGAMPQRAATVKGYIQGIHQQWLIETAKQRFGQDMGAAPVTIETRYRYNPDVKSLPAMVPAIIPMLLLMIPAILTALSVSREKEMGSIINLYVTPITRAEFMLGKQLPYIVLAMLNFFLMALLAVTLFGVPMKGSFLALTLASLFFVFYATAFGLFASIFTRSQIAALFFATMGTTLPTIKFAGMIDPVSSLDGIGRIIGNINPTTHYITICRGVFNKALGMFELQHFFIPILLGGIIILALSVVLLKKQAK